MQHPDDPMLSQLMDGEWHELDAPDSVRRLCADEAAKARWTRYHFIRDVMRNESPERLQMADDSLMLRVRDAIADEPNYTNITPFGGRQGVDQVAASPSGDVDGELYGVNAEVSAGGHGAADLEGKSRWMPDWRSGTAGFALAATVAGATVLGLNLWNAPSSGISPDGSSSVASAQSVRDSGLADGSAPGSGGDASVLVDGSAPVPADAAGVFAQQVPGAPLPQVEYVANTGAYWVTPSSGRSRSEARLNMFLSQHIENSPTADREGMLPYSRLVGYDERPGEQ